MFKKNQDGYTLLELMIAFTIFSMIILIVYTTFFTELKKFYHRSSLAAMNIESNHAMNEIIQEINQNSGIVIVNNNSISAAGLVIIDANNDPVMEGSRFSLDETTHTLRSNDGLSICQNVKSIHFILGPTVYDGIGITTNMLLIEIIMEDGEVTYTLQGGVNLAR